MLDERICLIDDWDHDDAFRSFIMYIYLSSYEVPSDMDISAACVLHARVYVLAERFCMEGLKMMAFQKMSSALNKDPWGTFLTNLNPETILEILQIVYDGTVDDQRWAQWDSSEGKWFRRRVVRRKFVETEPEAAKAEEVPEPVVEDAPAVEEELTINEGSVVQPRRPWDFGLTAKEKKKMQRQMQIQGTWEYRLTQEQIDEEEANVAAAAEDDPIPVPSQGKYQPLWLLLGY
ncbi:hypothetical protein H2198_000264 [Neophaeococcomyces mojaviensis]|uniref:Uncharacterized protein n=1 Tax=Neophaeococcomyces mojaviensis TaxID=3383035 RepID=A0ACC3AKU4_9EURO|nr:hypothetical protein H2198_000264 [Knufia sp. JES_112]